MTGARGLALIIMMTGLIAAGIGGRRRRPRRRRRITRLRR